MRPPSNKADMLATQPSTGSEATTHSHDWVAARREATSRFYSPAVMDSVWDCFWRQVGDLGGKRVLEYGCGRGDTFAGLLSLGAAHVVGIDIAPDMIAEARQRVAELHAASSIEAHVMDAQALTLADKCCDVVIGVSISHHLQLATALPEICRVLSDTGSAYAVFVEPLGLNPLLNWYRSRTPEYRTPDEYPLVPADVRLLSQYLQVEARFHNLASLAGSVGPLRWLMGPLRWLDRVLLCLPGVRWLGWTVVLKLTPRTLHP